jgi:hypothetical protein
MGAALVKGGTWEPHSLREVHWSCTSKGRYMKAALVKGGALELQ